MTTAQLNLLHGADVREAAASSDEGPSALEWFLGELDRMEGCRDTKERVRDLLRGMAGHRMFLAKGMLVTPERLRVASGLLDAGFTATQARAELAARAKVSIRTAQRIVAAALDQRAIAAIQARQALLDLGDDDGRTH